MPICGNPKNVYVWAEPVPNVLQIDGGHCYLLEVEMKMGIAQPPSHHQPQERNRNEAQTSEKQKTLLWQNLNLLRKIALCFKVQVVKPEFSFFQIGVMQRRNTNRRNRFLTYLMIDKQYLIL